MELKIEKTSGARGSNSNKDKGKIVFINDVMKVEYKSQLYIPLYSVFKTETLYSTPNNPKHAPFTKRENVNLDKSAEKMTMILEYWKPFKEGQLVNGYIKDEKFFFIYR